ncbi:MAG: ABC transporter [Candidatus Entotheonella factor]|uniref:ABC transporter n=1 Tax=Entotheonella factor TaxID=1429438 RepID=W4L9J0_ENTF1|nr:ABC transporter ATP-binding protein [Candidatus Entotheonella palauensis]ETW94692.1 MAG: ABC transporter [Candidatus Entotheonella factor]
MTILEAINLTKTYTLDDQDIPVLDRISLSIEDGEFVVLEGRSGSGKSTLLSLLSGLDQPTSGRVLIADQDITDWHEDELAPLRNATFGFVFQAFHLVPSLTALENVMFPAELQQDRQARRKAEALLERVGLQHRRHHFPSQLSGGEKQRCAMCRALINEPKIVFADEPTGNLDSASSDALLTLLRDIRAERDTTLLLATHSADISGMADRVVTLQDGVVSGDVYRGA